MHAYLSSLLMFRMNVLSNKEKTTSNEMPQQSFEPEHKLSLQGHCLQATNNCSQ